MPGLSPMEEAIEQARTMMEATLETDDDLAEAASGTDRRAVAALRDFVMILADHETVCVLESDGKMFRFFDVGEVRRTVDRLSQDTIHEAEETIEGVFQGVLPHCRSFEFKRSDTAEIISGRVGGDIESAAEISRVLERDVTISGRCRCRRRWACGRSGTRDRRPSRGIPGSPTAPTPADSASCSEAGPSPPPPE